jgi:hypothetical protein
LYVEVQDGLGVGLFVALEEALRVGIEIEHIAPVGPFRVIAGIGLVDMQDA